VDERARYTGKKSLIVKKLLLGDRDRHADTHTHTHTHTNTGHVALRGPLK